MLAQSAAAGRVRCSARLGVSLERRQDLGDELVVRLADIVPSRRTGDKVLGLAEVDGLDLTHGLDRVDRVAPRRAGSRGPKSSGMPWSSRLPSNAAKSSDIGEAA